VPARSSALPGVLRSANGYRLLFETDPADPAALVVPLALVSLAAVFAVLPPAIRAVRTDPARMIATEN